MVTQPRRLRALALLAASSLIPAIALATPIAATADTSPAAGTPATVSSDPLPTVQVDGVVWTQVVIGNTVFVGGSFANAYPAGSAPGVNLTPRANMLAYDLTTGNLIPGFAPTLNAQVRALAASPDGTMLYAGGNFTNVNGINEYRTVALNPKTGAVITSFKATTDAAVTSLAATSTTLYVGGAFSSVGTTQRAHAASVDARTGALNSAWAPVVPDGYVRAIVVSPDGSKVVLGGSFSSVNGSTAPGRGLAMVDSATGTTNLPFAVGNAVWDHGTNASIETLWSDGTAIYGTGYVYGSLTDGNLEGTFSASWADGTINWIEDCHGDTYGVAGLNGVLYTASHAHYCGNIPGGFPQTDSSSSVSLHQHALAFTAQATGTVKPNSVGNYYNWGGQPAPSLLSWFPDFATGTITGMNQAAWNVTTTNGYVLYAGEFPSVDGATQAGLVRFAVPSIAPNTDGPRLGGSKWLPTATSTGAGSVRVSWIANWDRDNEHLTYSLYRNGSTTPIFTTAADSDGFWNRPAMTFVDSGLTPGSTVSYQVRATDAFGNSSYSGAVSAVVGSTNPGTYANTVIADGASDYWRLDEPSGSTVYDWAGGSPLATNAGVTQGVAGALAGDSDAAASFNGTSTGYDSTQQMVTGPQTFSVEAWFNTRTTLGGKIVGFGNQSAKPSTSDDRHITMDTKGALSFGVSSGGNRILTSARGYNDGRWHQVVGTLGASGMAFYVDGTLVGTNPAVTSAGLYSGYWRVGGDKGWTSQTWFNGSIDEVAVYPSALSPQQVANHWTTATVAAASTPSASFTASTTGLSVAVDGSASSDTGSTLTGYAWDFGDGATDTAVTSNHTYAAAGTYPVKLTVTDALGATSSTTRSVTVAAPVLGAADSFSRTVGSGLGTADSGGAWTTSGGSSNVSVGSGVARFSTPAGITLSGVLSTVSFASSDVQATIAENALPVGGSAFASVIGRKVGTDDYTTRLTISATGTVTIALLHGSTVLKTATVTGLTVAPGTQLRLRMQAVGSSPTTLQARVWALGTSEPATWQVSATDSTAAMQMAGSPGIRTYSGGGVTNGPLVTTFDDFAATSVQ